MPVLRARGAGGPADQEGLLATRSSSSGTTFRCRCTRTRRSRRRRAREAFKQKGPTAFWTMHDKMFANQQHIKRDDLDGYAKELNLDMDKWKAALDGSTHTSEIEADKTAASSDQHQRDAGVPHRPERRQAGLLHQRSAGLHEVPQAHRARARRGEVVASSRDASRDRQRDAPPFPSKGRGAPFRGIWIMTMNVRSVLLPLLVLPTLACGAGAPVPAPPTVQVTPAVATAPVATQAAVLPTEDDAAVPISPRNPTWGSRTALVTIVEFSDFQCPFCARVLPTLSALREMYGPEKLRIVWKNNPLPFHPNARPAAEAAQGVFELAGPQRLLGVPRHGVPEAGVDERRELRALGAVTPGVSDVATLRAGLASHRWADAVDTDLREASDVGVQGTPSFFVNGVFVVGAQPLESFKKTVDAELAKAQAKVAAGTPRERVYAEMARENRANAPKHGRRAGGRTGGHDARCSRCPSAPARCEAAPGALVTIVEFGDFQCPFTRARRGDARGGPRRSTATRSASSGRTSRCRSTRTPSRPPRPRSRCAPRRATPRSGRCTTSSSRRRRTCPRRRSTRLAGEVGGEPGEACSRR